MDKDLSLLVDALSNVKVEDVKQIVLDLQKVYDVEVITEEEGNTNG